MWVTIYTDASYIHDDGSGNSAGAFAYYIRSSNGRIQKAGKIPGNAHHSAYCEYYAVYRAIKHADKIWGKWVTGIQINSDNMGVVKGLWPWSKPSSHEQTKQLQRKIQKLLNDAPNKILIKTKHVKAHQPDKTNIRTWINTWCDSNAKQARKEL